MSFNEKRREKKRKVSVISNFSTKQTFIGNQRDQKKITKVAQKLFSLESLEKLKILIPLQKLPNNVGDLGKLIVAMGFEKLPKVQ